MKVIRLQSENPETEFAPSWNIPVQQSLWNEEKIDIINKWLCDHESMILDLPFNNDGGTGLDEKSVTTRFGRYNLFDYIKDLPELKELLEFFQKSYINFATQEKIKIRDLDIICWFNILRKGQIIKEHCHGSGPDVYLSGNMHLGNYHTETYYVSPYEINCKYYIKNKKGCLTLFPTYLRHGSTQFDEDDLRVSIAFDLRLSGKNNLCALPFMNNYILNSL